MRSNVKLDHINLNRGLTNSVDLVYPNTVKNTVVTHKARKNFINVEGGDSGQFEKTRMSRNKI